MGPLRRGLFSSNGEKWNNQGETVKYLVRRVIFEDRWQAQLADLIALCGRVPIEEVLLLEQSHQMLMAPWPLEKHRRMAEVYRHMAVELHRHGIGFGVNIATLVGHGDTWVTERYLLPYSRFVGADLKPAHACYCLLDEGWQEYAASVCALYALGQPGKLFVDDDFRTLNHSVPVGCFCPIHARRTSEALGITLTSEALLRRVAGTSAEDRATREAWMRINFEGLLAAARKIRVAVAQVSPVTRVGLMISNEPGHALQGRDNDRLLREFAGPGRRPLTRPTGGAYCDILHGEVLMAHQRMALDISVLGTDVEIVSEVENYPHTRFSKSVAFTRLQMFLHALAGAEGMTLNIFDYLATPFDREPQWERMLSEIKPSLARVAAEVKGKRLCGFGLPWRREMAQHRDWGRGGASDLLPSRPLDMLLPQIGLPVQFTPAEANALLGTDVMAYDDAEIREFLKGGLLLDAEAAALLGERGFADQIGCRIGERLPMSLAERLDDREWSGPFQGDLMPTKLMDKTEGAPAPRRLDLLPGARGLTMLLDAELAETGPGMLVFDNPLGGRVAVVSAPVHTWTWFYRSRAWLIGKTIRWLMRGRLPVWVEDTPNVGVFYYEDPKTRVGLAAVPSACADPVLLRLCGPRSWSDLWSSKSITNPSEVRLFEIQFFTSPPPDGGQGR